LSWEELLKTVRPPDRPVCTDSDEDWKRAEERLGHPFPSDYRALVHAYGSGAFDDWLRLLNPFTRNPHMNLFRQGEQDRKINADLLRNDCFDERFASLVVEGRLLLWADTIDGDVIYWVTDGDPESWPVIMALVRSPDWYRFEFGSVEFLLRLVSRSLGEPWIDGKAELEPGHCFSPVAEPDHDARD
jgi:hypothetical protein